MRALEWANEKLKPNPDVVGGVINLGFCLDLTTRTGCNAVAEAYQELQKTFRASQKQLPNNTIGKDKLRRELDCLVIMYLHKYRQMAGLPPYDSVRAAFPESDPLYPGAGFSAKGHIQICIRNTAKCIKGYFRPLKIRH